MLNGKKRRRLILHSPNAAQKRTSSLLAQWTLLWGESGVNRILSASGDDPSRCGRVFAPRFVPVFFIQV